MLKQVFSKKTVFMKKYLYLLGCLVFTLCSCKDSEHQEMPDKPSNVPNSAIWIGGTKGGTFIDCRNTGSIRIYTCDVYSETGSELLKGGKYELKYAVWNDEKKSMEYYDLNDVIAPSAYHEIYISETSDIELGGRLVFKPIKE